MSPPPRFSFLSLDRWHLAGRPDEGAGVAEDEEAQRHLDSLHPAEIPGWVRQLEEPPMGSSWRRWVPALAVAAAAVVFVVPRPASPEIDPVYVGVKGAPSVGVHVQRDGRTGMRSDMGPLRAGDVIRLQVAPAGLGAVTVLSGEEVLHSGVIDPAGSTLLPGAWALDGEPTALTVVFTPTPPERPSEVGRVPGAHVVDVTLTGGL